MRDFLGLLYEEMKDYERAIQTYQTNVEIDPTFFDSILHLGFVSYRLQQNDGAISYLEQAVTLSPKRPEPYFIVRADVFSDEGLSAGKGQLRGRYSSGPFQC